MCNAVSPVQKLIGQSSQLCCPSVCSRSSGLCQFSALKKTENKIKGDFLHTHLHYTHYTDEILNKHNHGHFFSHCGLPSVLSIQPQLRTALLFQKCPGEHEQWRPLQFRQGNWVRYKSGMLSSGCICGVPWENMHKRTCGWVGIYKVVSSGMLCDESCKYQILSNKMDDIFSLTIVCVSWVPKPWNGLNYSLTGMMIREL